ncbi:hypothetical protein HYS00_05275 [Candidatus Microgenomates bacterium]|nr:hypothetical protein [Candidatus Microgenomates bacterium]
MNDFQKALPKLSRIFDLLAIPEDTKKTMMSALIDGVITLAGSRTAERNPELVEQINAMDTVADSDLTAAIDDKTKDMFVEEIMQILNGYIVELGKTVTEDKRAEIVAIWEE